MSLDGLYPFAGNHAIQSAVFVLEWMEPLLPGQMVKVRAAAETLKADFPAIQDQQLLMLNLNMGLGNAAPNQIQTAEHGGFVLSRDSTLLGGPSRTIVIGRDNCQVTVPDYSRWDKVLGDVARYLNALLPAFERPFRVVGLQYQDVFNWRSEPDKLPLKEIFNTGSKYLPANVFALDSLWHSHHGYFEQFATPRSCRQLDNINVSRMVNAGAHSIQILTSHRAEFEAPVWEQAMTDDSVIALTFERMHAKNKDILRELLSEDVQALIKLNKQDAKHAI